MLATIIIILDENLYRIYFKIPFIISELSDNYTISYNLLFSLSTYGKARQCVLKIYPYSFRLLSPFKFQLYSFFYPHRIVMNLHIRTQKVISVTCLQLKAFQWSHFGFCVFYFVSSGIITSRASLINWNLHFYFRSCFFLVWVQCSSSSPSSFPAWIDHRLNLFVWIISKQSERSPKQLLPENELANCILYTR